MTQITLCQVVVKRHTKVTEEQAECFHLLIFRSLQLHAYIYDIAPIPHTESALMPLRAVLAQAWETGYLKIHFLHHLEAVSLMPVLATFFPAGRLTKKSRGRFL